MSNISHSVLCLNPYTNRLNQKSQSTTTLGSINEPLGLGIHFCGKCSPSVKVNIEASFSRVFGGIFIVYFSPYGFSHILAIRVAIRSVLELFHVILNVV